MNQLFDVLYNSKSGQAAAALAALADALVEITLHDPDPMNRTEAARLMTSFRGEEIDRVRLAGALDDSFFRVRYYAVQVLADAADPAVLNRLAPLLGDIDPMVRQEVLSAFVKHGVGYETIVPELVLLLRDSNPAIRTNAARVLGQTGSGLAVTKLLAHLHDPDSRVTQAAAQALGELGDEAAAEALFALVNDETTYYRLREACLLALAKIDPPGLTDMLFALLDERDLTLRRMVVNAVNRVPQAAQVHALLDAADWHTSLVRPVRDALVRAGGGAVEAVMVVSLGHVREWVRALAVEVLGELQCADAVTDILPLLGDEAREVRVLAANALGQIGDVGAVAPLKAALKDDVWLVQVAAASALARIDSPEAHAASSDWQIEQRLPPDKLDLDTDEPPPEVDLSDIL